MPEPADAPDAPQTDQQAVAPGNAPAPARASRPDPKAFVVANWRAISIIGLLALGVTVVMLGWYGAAHTNIVSEQIPYLISGGLLGLGLIIMAGILAASASQERDAERLRLELTRALSASRAFEPGEARAPTRTNGHHVFVVPGGRSYHEAGCPILESKEGVEELVPARAVGSGYAACKLCGPDA